MALYTINTLNTGKSFHEASMMEAHIHVVHIHVQTHGEQQRAHSMEFITFENNVVFTFMCGECRWGAECGDGN